MEMRARDINKKVDLENRVPILSLKYNISNPSLGSRLSIELTQREMCRGARGGEGAGESF